MHCFNLFVYHYPNLGQLAINLNYFSSSRVCFAHDGNYHLSRLQDFLSYFLPTIILLRGSEKTALATSWGSTHHWNRSKSTAYSHVFQIRGFRWRLSKTEENKGDSSRVHCRNFHLEMSGYFTEIKKHIVPAFMEAHRGKNKNRITVSWAPPSHVWNICGSTAANTMRTMNNKS